MNCKLNIKLLTLLLTLGLFTTQSAYALGDRDSSLIISLAGISHERVDEDNDPTTNDRTRGFGVMFESNFNDHLGVEVGLLFKEQKFLYQDSFAKIETISNRIHLPILVRFWPTDFLSFGVGPFFSFKNGETTTTVQSGTFTDNYSSKGDDQTFYGLEAAATLNVAVNDKSGLFVEGRYSDITSENINEDTSQLALLAGIKIDIQ